MGFADWKKRSEAFANVMTYSVPTRSNILRALQAAYKAGERDGRKQAEAVAEQAIKLRELTRSNAEFSGATRLHRGASAGTPGYAAQRRKEKEMAIGPNVVDDCEGMTEEDYWRGMDEAMQDEEGDEPFCNCTTGHGIEEMDWNQCDSCGKPIYDEEPADLPAPTFKEGTEK